jgi:hypothetical protein
MEGEMIVRLWRGWTTPENADRYEELIRLAIFPGILKRAIAGLDGLELFRKTVEAEVEFMTLMRFASWEAVKAFAGPDWEASVVPEAARAMLARFDERARHYEQRVARRSRQAADPYPIASSSSIMRPITESPIVQKPGSFASRPDGLSS